MIDTHVHTAYSADSDQDPRALVCHAIDLGVTHLAVTDHQENEFHPSRWSLDFEQYFLGLGALREEFVNQIVLSIGVEIGYAPQCDAMATEQIKKYPFDTVINSVHNINGVDLFYETFYEGKKKDEAYEIYLKTVLDSTRVSYPYTQIGHLGYIARYARYADRALEYKRHAETIDKILRTMIEREVVLELNASTDTGVCITPTEIIARYYALGGRYVAPASDAHVLSKLCRRYDDLCALAKEIGFTHWTFCHAGAKQLFPIG